MDIPFFIIGFESESNILETVNEYKEFYSNIEFQSITNSKHLPQLENPEELTDVIKNFLKK